MKQEYRRPELVEYGSAFQLTLGGGTTSFDFSLTWNPQNNSISGSVTTGGGCGTINGQSFCACS